MMSKEYLLNCLSAAKDNFIWNLYFFNARKQRKSDLLYETQKIRFTKSDYVECYAKQLLSIVSSLQIQPISAVEEYNGYNTKVSCDRLAVSSDLVRDNFSIFQNSLVNAGDANLKNVYKGYVLDGQPNQGIDGLPILFIKLANPMIPLNTKKAVVFKKSADDSLDGIDEQFCRLYLTTDCMLIDGHLYCFNHSFEKLFNIEQTLHNVKTKAIQTIVDAGFISNGENFTVLARSTNSRTFISLNDERLNRASDTSNRKSIGDASVFHWIQTDCLSFLRQKSRLV